MHLEYTLHLEYIWNRHGMRFGTVVMQVPSTVQIRVDTSRAYIILLYVEQLFQMMVSFSLLSRLRPDWLSGMVGLYTVH